MSYIIYEKKSDEINEDKGEYWRDESVEGHAKLSEYHTIVPFFLQYLPKNGRILEAGCGLGRILICLSRKGYNIEGIELNENAVRKIKDFDKDLKVVAGDILKMAYEGNSFDAVISLGVIEHFEEGPQRALKEMYRVLKPGGIFFVTVPYINLIRRFLYIPYNSLVVKIRRMQGFDMKFSAYLYSKKEMQLLLKKAGFEIIKIAPDDFVYPKSVGLYTDWTRYLGSKTTKWELNKPGKVIQKILNLFSPWLCCNCILFIASVKK